MIASTTVTLCCLCAVFVCQLRASDADARRQGWRAFATALPLGATVLPIWHLLAKQIADAIAPGADGYTSLVGITVDDEIPAVVGLTWMLLTTSVLTWPVAFRLIRATPALHAVLRVSFDLAAGYMTGFLLSGLIMRWTSISRYVIANRRSENIIDVAYWLLALSSWLLAIWFVSTIVIWILGRGHRRLSAFITAFVLTAPAIFPVCFFPAGSLPDHWPLLFQQSGFKVFGPLWLFVISGLQQLAMALVAAAGLAWFATCDSTERSSSHGVAGSRNEARPRLKREQDVCCGMRNAIRFCVFRYPLAHVSRPACSEERK